MKREVTASGDLENIAASLAQEFRWRRHEEILQALQEARNTLPPSEGEHRLKDYCRQKLEGRVARSYRHFPDRS